MIPCPPPLANPSKPRLVLPEFACDSHCHIMGPAATFPYAETRAYDPPEAPFEALEALHAHLGILRAVVVQASCYGVDNRAMVDALTRRPDTLRGVACLPLDCSEDEIAELDRVGVRGARFNFMSRITKTPPLDEIDRLLARMASFGWHAVLHFDPEQIPELETWINGLTIPHVIDHMGRLNAGDYGNAYFDGLCEILRRENAWVKISGAERGSAQGDPFADMLPIAHKLIEIAPDRILWGTDWPHPVLRQPMPDDGHLVDFVADLLPDEAVRQAVLVDNPARLYRF